MCVRAVSVLLHTRLGVIGGAAERTNHGRHQQMQTESSAVQEEVRGIF